MNTIRRRCPPCTCACECRCAQACPAVVATGHAVAGQVSAVIADNAFSGCVGRVCFAGVQFAPMHGAAAPMAVPGAIDSPFSVELTGLQPGTAYRYRAVVCTPCGFCFGAFESFVTLQQPAPEVVTGDALNIVANAADIVGNAFSGIPGTIDFVAVEYSAYPDLSASMAAYGAIGSPFSVSLTGLQPGATYYYRAAVGASDGTHLGEIKSFQTAAPAVSITTGDAVNITPSSALIANNLYSGIPEPVGSVGVQYSINPAMAGATLVLGVVGSPFSVYLTGLQPNTSYYYQAVVGATGGPHYGAIKSFTTPNIA